MEDFLLYHYSNYGLIVLILSMYLNGLVSAPPSELTYILAAYFIKKNIFIIVFLGSVSNLIGTFTLFIIARRHPIFFKKYILLIFKKKAYKKIFNFCKKYPIKSICFFRVLPIIRSIISIPSAMTNINKNEFLFYTYIGCFTWAVMWSFIGRYLFFIKNDILLITNIIGLLLVIKVIHFLIKKELYD